MELVRGNLKHLYKANNENNIQYFGAKSKVPTCSWCSDQWFKNSELEAAFICTKMCEPFT